MQCVRVADRACRKHHVERQQYQHRAGIEIHRIERKLDVKQAFDHEDRHIVSNLLGGGDSGTLGSLTRAELDVLALMAEGLSDRGIADRLYVSPRTVETHVRHVLTKLDLAVSPEDNRRVLAVLAYLRG